MPPKLARMKPSVAQRVLLSIGLALDLFFGLTIYMNDYGSSLVASISFQLIRIVVTLLALIMGFSGKKRIVFGCIYFGSFLVGIVANLIIGFNYLFAIFRGLFNLQPWTALIPSQILPYIVIALITHAPFVVAFFLRPGRKLTSENQSPATQFLATAQMPPHILQGEQRTLRGDLESLAGLLREGLINQNDYDRKKEEILRRL